MTQFNDVEEFHRVYGMPIVIEDTPVEARDTSRVILRLNLILEEFDELMTASLGTKPGEISELVSKFFNRDTSSIDFVEVADALGDLLYVVNGMAIELGIPLDDVFDEIHRSNMSKLGEDGKPIYREDGKVLKGPSFFQPAISDILFRRL